MMIEILFILALLSTIFFAWKMQKWKMRSVLLEESLHFATKSHEELKESFKALSQDALEKNQQTFLNLAKENFEKLQERAKGDLEKRQDVISHMVKPVQESLQKLDDGIRKLEKERKGDQSSLREQIQFLMDAKKDLTKETTNLVKALKAPMTRGQWGEIQLRRVIEMSGMLKHCDFYEQGSGENTLLRPDVIIKLPGGRQIIIDAKVPLDAYWDAMQVENDHVREEKLKHHAKSVRLHVTALSKKSYYTHFSFTPEFVVLFLPSETFFSAALQSDPSLIEIGVDQGVVIATPTTLIALLRTIAYGWKQENLSQHVEKVSALGHELYKRIVDMAGHFSKMGKGLTSAVDAYNKGIGSLENRVLVSARRFKDLGAASSELELDPAHIIDKGVREIGPE